MRLLEGVDLLRWHLLLKSTMVGDPGLLLSATTPDEYLTVVLNIAAIRHWILLATDVMASWQVLVEVTEPNGYAR